MPHSLLIILLSLFCIANAEVLTRSSSCADVLSYFRTNALKRVGPYGFSRFPPFIRRGGPIPVLSQAAAAAPRSANAAPQAGVDFSETNVQVAGVDEADIVKTDGLRVFAIRGRTFFVVDVKDGGAAGRNTGNLTLPTFGSEMLIEKDRVLVISRSFGRLDGKQIQLHPGRDLHFFPRFRRPLLTVVYHISVADLKPRLLATLHMEGSYVSSREVDGVARIVLKFDPTQKIPFTYRFGGAFPRGIINSRTTKRSRQLIVNNSTTKRNRQLIAASSINTWLPRYLLKIECSHPGCVREIRGFVSDCNDIYLPSEKFTGFGLLTVATLPLLGTIKPQNSASIASDSGDVYSTASSLYVATTEYRYDFFEGSRRAGSLFRTSLHKFDLGKQATYAGSGEVQGSVLNQFSMHDHKGVFFVATTEGAPWWRSRDTSKSKVTSFRLSGRKLVKVGEVGNLGIGERIFAVRYITTTAYVVTFRRIDPLYIVDLSKPQALRVTGELKIPGFSSYLHPLSNGRLLGVGQDATPEGRTTGAKVSLFDVSDVTKPREVAAWSLKGSFTTAEFDHRAFLFWPPEQVAVLPISVFGKDRFVGSVVLKVGQRTITEKGRIRHHPCCGRTFSPRIERNFVLGRTHLWSLSRQLLQINDIRKLTVEGSVELHE